MEQARSQLLWGVGLGMAMGVASLATLRPAALWVALPLAVVLLAWWIVSGAERWVLAFLAAAMLLPPLPLPGGNAGPHPAMLFAAIGVWAGVVRLLAWRIRWDFVSSALCFLLFALLLSVPWAALYSGWEVALGSLARVGLFAISVYLFFYVAYGPGRDLGAERLIRLMFWAGFASAAFACLDFYFQFPAPARFAEQFVWLATGVFRRAQGVFYEATTLGSFCTFLLVMIVSITALRQHRWLGLAPGSLAAAGLVLLAALIFSFSRSGIASLVVALIALAWLERRQLRTAFRLSLAAGGGLIGGAALLSRFFPDFLTPYFQRLWYTGQSLWSAPNLIFAPRLESWRLLLDYIAENPWRTVLGVGYKTLPYSEVLGRPVVADNMYLSMLLETGWIGLAALLLLNIAVLVTSFRQARQTGLRRLLGVWMFCFWCGQMVQMLSGDILTYWRLLPLYFSVLALCVRADEHPVSGSI